MTSAWECEACGKLHALKARADACCLCKTCGKQPSVYTGNNNDCEMCHAEKHLADARLCLANGEKMVADAEKRVAVLKRRLPAGELEMAVEQAQRDVGEKDGGER